MAHISKEPVAKCSVCTPRQGQMHHYVLNWSERLGDKRKFRRQTFHTRAGAVARKTEVEGEQQTTGRVRDVRAAEVPFEKVAQDWLDSMLPRVQNGKLKERTREEYAALLRRHVLPVWTGVPVGAITSQRAEAWARDLATKGLSARTYRHAWDKFARVLKYAVRHDILTTNPADRVELDSPHADNTEPFEGKALTAEEVARVVEQVGEQYPVYGVMVQFLAYTGVRAGELAGLNVGDLTLAETEEGFTGAVRISSTRRKRAGGWVADTPKSRAGRRTVPLDDWLAGLMANYLKAHPRGTDPTAPLFPHRKPGRSQKGGVAERAARLDWDQPIEPNSFYRNIFQRAVREAGLPPVRIHDLRHTFATLQLQNGPPDHYMQVSVWMGHADYAVTLKTYAHVIKRPGLAKAHQLPAPPGVPASAPAPTEDDGVVVSLAARRARKTG